MGKYSDVPYRASDDDDSVRSWLDVRCSPRTTEIKRPVTNVNPESFRVAHPFVLLEDDPPRRFATLRCAASTALEAKCPVEDYRSGKVYSGRQLSIAAEGGNPDTVKA